LHYPLKGQLVSKKQLVAVIEDDDPFRMALVESLSSFGYSARGFGSAEEFVATDVESACGCIVTDVHMPGMSGLDLMRLLAARASKVPVIVITAHADPGLEARALACGALYLLRKPFESGVLIDCLEKAMISDERA
jgi:FixJ family two-component response regulator